jgi:hypothetical protein
VAIDSNTNHSRDTTSFADKKGDIGDSCGDLGNSVDGDMILGDSNILIPVDLAGTSGDTQRACPQLRPSKASCSPALRLPRAAGVGDP